MTDPTSSTATPILEVAGLSKVFTPPRTGLARHRRPPVVAVDDVSFALGRSETLGVVGESGSGKSTLARLALRLIEPTSGRITFDGADITNLSGQELRRLRSRMQCVFQDVSGSLNAYMTIEALVAEPLRYHTSLSKPDRAARAQEAIEMVGLSSRHLQRRAGELSGGQRQRVAVARALASSPDLIVLDEPVSALDVSTQSQVVNLLAELQDRLGVAYLVIAHDLVVVHHMSHRIAVVYLGQVVEIGEAGQVFERPRHPYTQALLSAAPAAQGTERRPRVVLQGELPSPSRIPVGCRFVTRCPLAFDRCHVERPTLAAFGDGGAVACHLHDSGPTLAGASVDELTITRRVAEDPVVK